MKRIKFQIESILLAIVACLYLAGCGGTKMLKNPEPLILAEPLVTASDMRVEASLDWIIVRDGPGTWAKNADWDEYLVRVSNTSGEPVTITGIAVYDSMGVKIDTAGNRESLVKASRRVIKRYDVEGLDVKAGMGAAGFMVASGTTMAVGYSTVWMALYGSPAVATTALGFIAAAPVLAGAGVMRGVNNRRVSKEIRIRRTLLPIWLKPDDEHDLDLFFPIAPSPTRVVLTYTDTSGVHALVIDTSVVLNGLHLGPADV